MFICVTTTFKFYVYIKNTSLEYVYSVYHFARLTHLY